MLKDYLKKATFKYFSWEGCSAVSKFLYDKLVIECLKLGLWIARKCVKPMCDLLNNSKIGHAVSVNRGVFVAKQYRLHLRKYFIPSLYLSFLLTLLVLAGKCIEFKSTTVFKHSGVAAVIPSHWMGSFR